MLNIRNSGASIFQHDTKEDVEKRKHRIQQKLFNPSTVRKYEVKCISRENFISENEPHPSSVELKSSSSPFKLSQEDAMALSHIKWKLKSNDQECLNAFPQFTYLTLRNDQNLAWANERFTKGVALAKQALQKTLDSQAQLSLKNKAEICYKEGLEIIHDHPRLLCAYGALCANDGRLDMAKQFLRDAIRYGERSTDDNHNYNETVQDAKIYLNIVHNKESQVKQISSSKNHGSVAISYRAEKAMNDAQAERNLQMEASSAKFVTSTIGTKTDYSLLSSSDESSSYQRKKERRKRRKKEHRRHREKRSLKKRRRSELRNRDEDDVGSLSSSTTDNRKRHDRKDNHRRKERHRYRV